LLLLSCLQVKALLAGAMAAAVCVISANKGIHEGLSALLTKQERVEGEALERWLQHVVVSPFIQSTRHLTVSHASCACSPPSRLHCYCHCASAVLRWFFGALRLHSSVLSIAFWLLFTAFNGLTLVLLLLLQVPDLLRDFVVNGALPSASALQDAAVVPTLMLGEAMQHLKEASAATAAANSSIVGGSSSSAGDGGSSGGSSKGISSQSENGF
jgi:uncharacterized membrane protein YgcG